MKTKAIEIKLVEGYWRNPADERTNIYPMVRERVKAWKGRRDFIDALLRVEASKLVVEQHYKGSSKCRCCGAKNSSAEFELRLASNVLWTWPSGFMHYVVEHNVRPSLGFQMMITQVAAALAAKEK